MVFDLTNFNYRPNTIKRTLDQYVYGQEEVKKALSVAFWQHYSRLRRRIKQPQDPLMPNNKPNVLIIGGSGTGKTLIASRTSKLLGVVYLGIDSTDFSETGYIGKNVEEIPGQLYRAANKDLVKAELGVIHIDEIDKKSATLMYDDVSRASVQSSFLTLIEGKQTTVAKDTILDTSNVLFIASGAFDGIKEIVKERVDTIGFKKRHLLDRGLKKVRPTINDLEQYGMNGQLLARFPNIVYTEDLSSDDLEGILRLEKNPFIPDLIEDFAELGISVDITSEVYRSIADIAAKSLLGARALATTINETFRNYLYELGEREIDGITIDKSFIQNPTETLEKIIRGSKLKEQQSSVIISLVPADTPSKKRGEQRELIYETKEPYCQELRTYGLKSELIALAAEKGLRSKLSSVEVLEIIKYHYQQAEELEESFANEFGKTLILTEECKIELVNLALNSKTDDTVGAIAYELFLKIFEEKSDPIKNSKNDSFTLETPADSEFLDKFFEQL